MAQRPKRRARCSRSCRWTITERGTRAEARTRYPSGDERGADRRNVNVSVAYTVAAPEGTRIIVKSISGNISVRDIIGGLTLETVSGASASPTPGRMANGRSISGDIEIVDTKVEGALEAGTSAARCGFAASPRAA